MRRAKPWPVERAQDKVGLNRVCIDLDGLLAEDTWPSPVVGDPIPDGMEILRHFEEQGYEVAIFTSRPKDHEPQVRQWVKDHGLEGVVYTIIFDKPRAVFYVDDRAWNPWENGVEHEQG